LVIRSFIKIIARVIVTMDKAEAIGVIKIASPIVKPKFTTATEPASIIPMSKSAYFVFAAVFFKIISRFAKNEKINKNKIIPNLTNRVV